MNISVRVLDLLLYFSSITQPTSLLHHSLVGRWGKFCNPSKEKSLVVLFLAPLFLLKSVLRVTMGLPFRSLAGACVMTFQQVRLH